MYSYHCVKAVIFSLCCFLHITFFFEPNIKFWMRYLFYAVRTSASVFIVNLSLIHIYAYTVTLTKYNLKFNELLQVFLESFKQGFSEYFKRLVQSRLAICLQIISEQDKIHISFNRHDTTQTSSPLDKRPPIRKTRALANPNANQMCNRFL